MVADAAVIGMNHETRGEAPVAFVIGRRFHKLTAKDLRQYCRERMAAFKVPRQFVISDRLPRNALGRIQKRALPQFLAKSRANGRPSLRHHTGLLARPAHGDTHRRRRGLPLRNQTVAHEH